MRSTLIQFSLVLITGLCFLACTSDAGNTGDTETTADRATMTYDSLLAHKLGADAYGMKSYVMAFLLSGSNSTQDSTEAAALQRAHMDNIFRMAEEGTLVMAGPFMDTGDVRGIYVFDVRTIEEAEALTATDPAIKAGVLKMELHPWYGPAVLPMIKEWNEKVSKEKI